MGKKLVEHEKAIGGFERPELTAIVQVERHREAGRRRRRQHHRPQPGSRAGVLTEEAERQRHEEEEVRSRRQRHAPRDGCGVPVLRSDEPPQTEQHVNRVGHIPRAGDHFVHDRGAEHEDEPRQLQRHPAIGFFPDCEEECRQPE